MAIQENYDIWFLIVLNIFFAITAVLSNTLILAALNKESSLQSPSKILFFSLALTDFGVGLLSGPLFVVFLLTIQYERWDFLFYYSITITFVIGIILCSVSLFTLTAISVDRFLALLLRLQYRHVVTSKRILIIVLCFWTLNISFIIPVFFTFKVTVYYTMISSLSCIAVSTSCYAMIYQKLQQHQAQVQGHVLQRQANGEEPLNIARYRKTVCSALWVHFTLVACYLPVSAVLALMSINDINGLTPSLWYAWLISGTLVFLNSTLNPILYCWRIREVRRAAINIIRQIFCCLS